MLLDYLAVPLSVFPSLLPLLLILVDLMALPVLSQQATTIDVLIFHLNARLASALETLLPTSVEAKMDARISVNLGIKNLHFVQFYFS